MEKTPLVSIILPVYNGEKYLNQSIESCLNQTYRNIELIIVNDCSTDSSLRIMKELASKDSRIVIIDNQENQKLPASLNIGHNAAKGEFLTWTSDDNTYNANAIKDLLNALKTNNADLVYSNVSIINNQDKVKREVLYSNYEHLLFGNCIGACFLYKKEVFHRNKCYNERLFLVEDYDFWLRASLHSRFYHVENNLYKYRLHDESLTNDISVNEERNRLWKTNIRTMYEGFSKTISNEDYLIIADFQTKILTHQKIDFDWVKNNLIKIKSFTKKITSFTNYSNRKRVEKVFLKQIVHVYISNNKTQRGFLKSFYIIRKYINALDKNTLKTLIKYSFFK